MCCRVAAASRKSGPPPHLPRKMRLDKHGWELPSCAHVTDYSITIAGLGFGKVWIPNPLVRNRG